MTPIRSDKLNSQCLHFLFVVLFSFIYFTSRHFTSLYLTLFLITSHYLRLLFFPYFFNSLYFSSLYITLLHLNSVIFTQICFTFLHFTFNFISIFLPLMKITCSHDIFCSCRDCNGCCPLHLAAACGHVGILSSLLQVCGTGNITDNRGYTPLHWACYNGKSFDSTCLSLMLKGDNINLGCCLLFNKANSFVR